MDPITLTFAIIGLLVTVIAQRDQLISFFDGLKKRFFERREREKALEIVNKFANPDSKQQPSLLILYIPVFLISILSSGALSYLELQSQFRNNILLSASIYLSISMIVLVTFLVTARRFEWRFIIALFVGVLLVSFLWGIFVIIARGLGFSIIKSGILAGITVIFWLLDSDRRASRQSRV